MNITLIQKYLKDHNIDAYIAFISDDHGSEYIMPYYKSVAFLSNFTGSAGTLLICKDTAYLWTDGRYFLQASKQLKKSNTKLMKIGIDEDMYSFINKNVKSLAFDFKTASVSFVKQLNRNITLIDESKILNKIWLNRPKKSKKKIICLPNNTYKDSASLKCHKTLKATLNKSSFAVLICALDDIAYTLNLRGFDIPCNPVFMSFLFLSKIDNQEKYTLYIDKSKLTNEVNKKLKEENVVVKPYNAIYKDVSSFPHLIYYSANKTNYKLYSLMKRKRNVTLYPTNAKAIKNSIDIANTIDTHIRDGIAMCKFIYYVKSNVGKIKMSEISIADYLEKLRRKQGAFELSFNTIAGYKENGAIIHYQATNETNKEIKDDGFLLVDSGGQYYYGTTDITRTIAFNNLSYQMKYHFTLVLKAHIDLAMAVFDKNTTDAALDLIARKPLWDVNLDYNHGTGHGVGHLLNVHEGPININHKKKNPKKMKKGMISSDEPGLYFENQYGIRHENELLCVSYDKDHLCFKPITYVPFDKDAILVELLSEKERKYLNDYHQMVYNVISPFLNKKEREFLAKATKEI